MHLLLLCLCGVASYAVAEEPLEHITSGTSEAQHTRIYGLGSSGVPPVVPASTTLLATPYSLVGNLVGALGGLLPGIGGHHNNHHGGGHHNNHHGGAYPHNNQHGGGYPGQGGYPGGYPNNNNFPGQQQQQGGSSCRYWCRSPTNQYYCCNQQNGGGGGGGGGNVGTKPGFCPPVRPSCPPTKLFGPPQQCSNDYSCSGRDKCCFDTCLQHHTCKPTQGGGYGG